MELQALKNVNSHLNINIYSYLETSGGQSSNLYLNGVHFFNTVLIRHMWLFKKVVFLHWCLLCTVPLGLNEADTMEHCALKNVNNCLNANIYSASILIYSHIAHRIYTWIKMGRCYIKLKEIKTKLDKMFY
jgi:hypothetical protein